MRQGLLVLGNTPFPIKDYLYDGLTVNSNSISYKATENILTQITESSFGLSNLGGVLAPKDIILGTRNTLNLNYRIPTQVATTGGADTVYLNSLRGLLQILEFTIQASNSRLYPFNSHTIRWAGFGKFVPFAILESVSITTDKLWHNISMSALIKEWSKMTLMSGVETPPVGEAIADGNNLFTGTIGGGA